MALLPWGCHPLGNDTSGTSKTKINEATGPLVSGPEEKAELANEVEVVASSQMVKAFRCPDCPLSFTTKIGLGVHRTKVHPGEVNKEINPLSGKRRWKPEEDDLLARKEARLILSGSCHINESIRDEFPRRSIEAIKSRRKMQTHQDAVAHYLKEFREEEEKKAKDIEDGRRRKEKALERIRKAREQEVRNRRDRQVFGSEVNEVREVVEVDSQNSVLGGQPTEQENRAVFEDLELGAVGGFGIGQGVDMVSERLANHGNGQEEGVGEVSGLNTEEIEGSNRGRNRWSTEEERVFARKEAELTLMGCRFLNQKLLEAFPYRSLDSIKAKRRQRSYQKLVRDIIAEISENRVPEDRDKDCRGMSELKRIEETLEENSETESILPEGVLNFLDENVAVRNLELVVNLLEEEKEEIQREKRRADVLEVVVNLLEESREESIEINPIRAELRNIISREAPVAFQTRRLFTIVNNYLQGENVIEALDTYLNEVFPEVAEKKGKREKKKEYTYPSTYPRNVDPDSEVLTSHEDTCLNDLEDIPVGGDGGRRLLGRPVESRRKKRRADYAKMQDLYKKNRSRCAEELFGTGSVETPFSIQEFTDAWRPLLSAEGQSSARSKWEKIDAKREIWGPVTVQEILNNRITKETSPGPDGITTTILRTIPSITLCALFNLIISIGKLPCRLNKSRTVFIPKTENPCSPLDYRPISITSILTRQLHKILAKRLDMYLDLDDRQRGFIHADGCAENILLLSTVFKDAHETKQELHVVAIDIKKAFDSVTYGAIQDDLCEAGCPEESLNYLAYAQETAVTILEVNGCKSEEIKITRGVRQGDPLSPKVFNACMDRLLRRLPPTIGYNLNGRIVNSAAFADDFFLLSSTKEGMKELIKITEEELTPKGLLINSKKCTSISLIPDGKRKKMFIDPEPNFMAGGELIPVTSVEATFRYLGVQMTPTGSIVYKNDSLESNLQLLRSAPLKPQQRLCLLRDHLLPKYTHQLVFASLGAGKLNSMDIIVRAAVRQWLFLPHDVPTSFFHASVKDGGLGIPALRWMIPRLTLKRLNVLLTSDIAIFQIMSQHSSFQKQIRRAEELCKDQGRQCATKLEQEQRWASLLHQSVDGRGLNEAREVPAAHHWIRDGSKLLTGRDFLMSVKLRIAALPTRARTARGRNEETKCRAGCYAKETLQHVLQCCPRTHGTRVKRHDGVVKLLKSQLERRGHDVTQEPKFRTLAGLRKPDLLVVRNGEASIIDVQVTQDDKPLEQHHRRKTDYYANNPCLQEQVRTRTNCNILNFSSFTITWRGVVCGPSARHVLNLGLKPSDLKLLAVRTIQGGLYQWGTFNKMTAPRDAPRAGIG